MNTMAPTRPADLQLRRIPLAAGPIAVAEARSEVKAAIRSWEAPVDLDVAVLLTSELMTNAIRHEAGGTVTLTIDCSGGQLRVDVHDTSGFMPVLVEAAIDAETGRGLMLVASLADDWGFYRTPSGKAVYFALAFQPDLSSGDERGGPLPQGFHTWRR
jgi:anti-sigma regulatory factor (Ser/Thr protein kinase)